MPGDIEKGKEELFNAQRREARLRRRQARRRARRLTRVAKVLSEAELLPPSKSEVERQRVLDEVDAEILSRYPGAAKNLPYFLRARALDFRLEPYELGRAIYHLAQRRGFLSSRKEAPKEDDEAGKVKSGISELGGKMALAGSRTLGEYLATLDPQQERIRARYTARKMYEEEFDRIWKAQSPGHPSVLTEAFRGELHKAIFFQRPLRIRKEFIGECEFERGRSRAPWALLSAQRFRLLQKVNDLRFAPDEWSTQELTPEQRAKVAALLEDSSELSFSAMRKHLMVKTKFNLERGGEKRLKGNTTNAALRKILGEKWDAMPRADKDRLIEDWLSFVNDDALKRRAVNHWGMTEAQAEAFAHLPLQSGYCGLSRRALEKLLPHMEEGTQYMTAADFVYRTSYSGGAIHDYLPPVRDAEVLRALRNPMVERTLTEMRKVVNGIVRAYGKPEKIVVELARDLKKGREERERTWKHMRGRESERKKAAEALVSAGVQNPKDRDIEKWRLAEECGWECPYTGRKISVHSLFSAEPEFDVEHIIPRGRSLDDSFPNKTLCHVHANRNEKGGKTPREAYGGDPARYEEMLKQVKKFLGEERLVKEKLRRFEMTTEEVNDLLSDFTEQQLNDTRYASKMAANYLGMLYGGRDQDGERKIFVTSGSVTAMLRSAWEMNKVLGAERKDSGDHRHHLIDAIAIALTEPKQVSALARAAEMSAAQRKRKFQAMPGPMPDFVDKVRACADTVVISPRMNHVLRGALHEETNYGKADEQGRRPTRKAWDAVQPKDIIDPAVRAAVERATKDNPPFLESKDGRRIQIKRVRIGAKSKFDQVGTGHRERSVIPGDNHHVAILEKDGKWRFHIVTRLDAVRRQRAGLAVIDRGMAGFKFSLSNGDVVELNHPMARYWSLKSISQEGKGRLMFAPIHLTAQKAKELDLGERWMVGPFQKLDPKKVQIDPLGRVFPAND